MYICECGREFTTPQGLGYHKKYCGNYKEFLDGGYKAKIGSNGNIVYIHREVMEQKLGRKLKPGELVHHEDEDKLNNDPSNLELSDKSNHAKHHCDPKRMSEISYLGAKRGISAVGSKHPNSKLNEDKVRQIKELLKDGQSQSSLGRLYGVDRTIIRDIKFNRAWKHVN